MPSQPVASTTTGNNGRSAGTAVFTMARNESVFLPIWVAYYRRFFPAECVHVFDHLGTDGSAETVRDRYGCVLHREGHAAYDDFDWYTRRVEELQAELLSRHRVVIFAESDEIIWHPGRPVELCRRLRRPRRSVHGLPAVARPGDRGTHRPHRADPPPTLAVVPATRLRQADRGDRTGPLRARLPRGGGVLRT